jgi:hypothetical protein
VLELHKLIVALAVDPGVYLYHTSGPGEEPSQLTDTPASSVAPFVVPVYVPGHTTIALAQASFGGGAAGTMLWAWKPAMIWA